MAQEEPDYDIFKDLDVYETIIHEVYKEYSKEPTAKFCDNINLPNEYNNQVIVLCRKFVSFYKNLKKNCNSDNCSPVHKKYSSYLNFWISHQLELQSIPKNDKLVLYKNLKDNLQQYDEDRKLQVKLYNVNDNDFKSMNMLYKLYKNYNGSLSEYNNDCDKFFHLFKENYDKCLYRCYAEGDSKLCDVMNNFRKLYDNEKFPSLYNCKKDSFPLLPELSEYRPIKLTDSEDSNIGYQLVQTANFFKKFELPQLKRENYKELNELIWLQYNMPFQLNEEMKKNNMMNILQQFLQYCYENKKNERLSSFMKELIDNYYNKIKGEYDNIFSDCKKNGKGKTHCQLYKECVNKFSKDLLTIEKDTNEYITQQVKYIESLSSLELWIYKAQSMFQDFGAMSRISPTVMSTMVAIVVCLFFLYKLTPLSSIFRKEKKRRKIPLFFPERPINDVKNHNSGNKNAKHKRGKIRFAYQPN
ncbi:PIR protein [Plasmodium vivax]|nr:PIR protein [Plasmodium vivax]